MNLRHFVRVTVDGTRVRVTLKRCPDCPRGTVVYRPEGFRSCAVRLGHITLGRRNGPAAMWSSLCPGDVGVSSAHGMIRRHPHRMGAFMGALRSVVRDDFERTAERYARTVAQRDESADQDSCTCMETGELDCYEHGRN